MSDGEMNIEIAFTFFFIILMFSIILCRDTNMDRSWSFEDAFQR